MANLCPFHGAHMELNLLFSDEVRTFYIRGKVAIGAWEKECLADSLANRTYSDRHKPLSQFLSWFNSQVGNLTTELFVTEAFANVMLLHHKGNQDSSCIQLGCTSCNRMSRALYYRAEPENYPMEAHAVMYKFLEPYHDMQQRRAYWQHFFTTQVPPPPPARAPPPPARAPLPPTGTPQHFVMGAQDAHTDQHSTAASTSTSTTWVSPQDSDEDDDATTTSEDTQFSPWDIAVLPTGKDDCQFENLRNIPSTTPIGQASSTSYRATVDGRLSTIGTAQQPLLPRSPSSLDNFRVSDHVYGMFLDSVRSRCHNHRGIPQAQLDSATTGLAWVQSLIELDAQCVSRKCKCF